MDNVFGIGIPELVLILLIAGIVMGPERIAQSARWLGKTTAQLQAISRGFVRQLHAELDSVDEAGEIKGAVNDLSELQRQIAELRTELTSVVGATVTETKTALGDTRREIENSIMPEHFSTSNGSPANVEDESSLPSRLDISDDPE